jgi:hypothetical protein
MSSEESKACKVLPALQEQGRPPSDSQHQGVLQVQQGWQLNNFVDTNVLICGSDVTGVVVVLKSFVYSGLLMGVSIVGQAVCGGWLGDTW